MFIVNTSRPTTCLLLCLAICSLNSCIDSLNPIGNLEEQNITPENEPSKSIDTLLLKNLFSEASDSHRHITASEKGRFIVIATNSNQSYQMSYSTTGKVDASSYTAFQLSSRCRSTREPYNPQNQSPFLTIDNGFIYNPETRYSSERYGAYQMEQSYSSKSKSYFKWRAGFEMSRDYTLPYSIVAIDNKTNEKEVIFSSEKLDSLGVTSFSIVAVNDHAVAFTGWSETCPKSDSTRLIIANNSGVITELYYNNKLNSFNRKFGLTDQFFMLDGRGTQQSRLFNFGTQRFESAEYLKDYCGSVGNSTSFTFNCGVISAYDLNAGALIWKKNIDLHAKPRVIVLANEMLAFVGCNRIAIVQASTGQLLNEYYFTTEEGVSTPYVQDLYFYDGSLHVIASNITHEAISVGKFEVPGEDGTVSNNDL